MNVKFKKALMLCVVAVVFVGMFAFSAFAATTTSFPDLTIYLPLSEANGKSVIVTDYITANIVEGTAYGDYYVWPEGDKNYGSAPAAPNPGWIMGTNTSNSVRMTRASGNVTTFNSTSAAVSVGQEFDYTINIYDHLSSPTGATISGAKVKIVIVEDTASVPGAMTIGIATADASGKDITAKISNRIKNLGTTASFSVVDGTATYSGYDDPVNNKNENMTVEVEAALSDALVFSTTSGTPVTGQDFSFVISYKPDQDQATAYSVPVKVTLYDVDPDAIIPTTFPDLTIDVPVSAANAGTYNIYSQVFANIVGGTNWNGGANAGIIPCTYANRRTAYDEEGTNELKVYANVSTDSAAAGRVPLIRTAADSLLLNSNSMESGGILYTISLPAYTVKTLVAGDTFYYDLIGYENLGASTGQFAAKVTINVVADPTTALDGDYVTATVYESAVGLGKANTAAGSAPAIRFDSADFAAALGGTSATVTSLEIANVTTEQWVANRYYITLPSDAAADSEYTGTASVTVANADGTTSDVTVNVKIIVAADPDAKARAEAEINAAATVVEGDDTQYLITANAAGYKGAYRAASGDSVMTFKGVVISNAVNTGSAYQNLKTTKGGWGTGGNSIKFQADATATAGVDDTAKLAFTVAAVSDTYGIYVQNQYVVCDAKITVRSESDYAQSTPLNPVIYSSAANLDKATTASGAAPAIDFGALATALSETSIVVESVSIPNVVTEKWIDTRYYVDVPSGVVGTNYTGEVTVTGASGTSYRYKITLSVVADPSSKAAVEAAINEAATVRAGDDTGYLITAAAGDYKGSYRPESGDAAFTFRGVIIDGAVSTGTAYQNLKTAKGGWGAGGTSIKFQADIGAAAGADDTVQLAFTGTPVTDSTGVYMRNQYVVADVNITVLASTPTVVADTMTSRTAISGTTGYTDAVQQISVPSIDFTDFTITEVGVLVIKNVTLGNDEIDLNNINATKLVADVMSNPGTGSYTINAAVWDIPDTEVGEVIVTRAFVTYQTTEGATETYYAPAQQFTVA